MVKLARHPTSQEMLRLRKRWDREDAEEIPLKPFDTTLTSGIDDTVQHLRGLRGADRKSEESDELRFDAIQQLTAEARFMRKALAGVVETLNHKASKRVVAKTLDAYSVKLEKRVDNIFKLVSAIAAIFGVVIAAFTMLKR